MQFPKMSGGRSYSVKVPKLSGGVNLAESPHLIDDDQLSDVKNMWWKDGALRTRPGLFTDAEMLVDARQYFNQSHDVSFQKNPRFFNSFSNAFFCVQAADYDPNTDRTDIVDYVAMFSKDGKYLFQSAYLSHYSMAADVVAGASSSLSEYGAILFSRYGSIDGFLNGVLQSLDSQVYVPLVLVNNYPSEYTDNLSVNGQLFEGFNLLTPKFRAAYTSNAKGRFYALPYKNIDDAKFVVERTAADGSVYTYTVPAGQTISNSDGLANPMHVKLDRVGGIFSFTSADGSTTYAVQETGISNNIVVTASKHDKYNPGLICGMTFNTWFGGDRSGVSGGTRLFVGGNPEHPNLVHWSDVNNPLYFPENNYAYVGSAAQRVTAFGKQADMLVIFKEREMYYSTYVAGASYTAEDVMDGRVVDVTSNAAVFPITPINSYIGCDAPKTVQLCANRLVWANTDGKVYTLVNANQYSERNVRAISQNIERALAAHSKEEISSASAADYDGHYYLMVGNSVYVLDYMSVGFISYASYASEEKAQKGLAWFIWEIPPIGATVDEMYTSPYGVFITAHDYDESGSFKICTLSLHNGKDVLISGESFEIPSMFKTKTFDFKNPAVMKNVSEVFLGVGRDENAPPISITYLTDKGEPKDPLVLEPLKPSAGVYSAQYIDIRRITPRLNRILRFGIRGESGEAFSVDSLEVKYSLYNGGVR